MRNFKYYIVMVLMSLCCTESYAHDFEADGIYYNITSMANLEVEVTHWGKCSGDEGDNTTPYSGNITIPQQVTYNNRQYTVVGIGKSAFGTYHIGSSRYHGTSITGIVLPNTIRYIGNSAFCKCENLTNIELPKSLTSINDYAFYYSKLKGIIIPDNITVIYGSTFSYSNLEYVVFGKNIQTVNDYAFSSCSKLREILFTGSSDIIPARSLVFANCTQTIETYIVRRRIIFDKKEFTYNGIEPVTNWENNLKQLDCSLVFPELPKDAGEHEVICTANFSGYVNFVCDIPYKYTINKAPLTITANNKSKTYGDENPSFDATYSGFVNDENKSVLSKCELSTTATASSDAGTYPIKVLADAKNYDITAVNGTLTINKAPLTATVVSSEKVYGDENPAFAVTYSGLKNNETNPKTTKAFSYTTEANKLSGVGSYPVTASNGEFKNYDVTKYIAGTLTVKKASLTISCNDATKVYGDVNPMFSFTYSGFKNNDTEDDAFTLKPSVDTEVNKRSTVGEYEIIGSNAAAKNYSLEYLKGTLTITKAPLTITANDATREYGNANPTFTFKYDGFKNDETDAVLSEKPTATSVGRVSDAGEYNIVSDGASATNYDISYGTGKLTITKAPLEVKVNDASRLYGESNPEFTFSYTGFKNDDDASVIGSQPTVTTDATTDSPVGTYTLSASDGEAKNYDFKKYTSGILTIGKAELKVIANNQYMTYGDVQPTLTYTCSGLRNSDTNESAFSKVPSLNCSATATSNCGEYPIQIGEGTSNNYVLSYEDGTMTVDKRELVATVGKYTRPYNTENPAFEVKYTGFVNGDDETKITTKPTVSCEATISSDTGDYEISLYGGNAQNYSFAFVNGKLTIEKAEQDIVWEDTYENVVVGDQIELTAKVSSGLDIEYTISDESIANIYTAGKNKVFLDCQKEGTVILKAKQSGNNNYYSSVVLSKTIVIKQPSGIQNITNSLNDPTVRMYNINGQRVNDNSKGIVIINGKKYLRR